MTLQNSISPRLFHYPYIYIYTDLYTHAHITPHTLHYYHTVCTPSLIAGVRRVFLYSDRTPKENLNRKKRRSEVSREREREKEGVLYHCIAFIAVKIDGLELRLCVCVCVPTHTHACIYICTHTLHVLFLSHNEPVPFPSLMLYSPCRGRGEREPCEQHV